MFEPYQSVEANQPGLVKFMQDLFVTGTLTKGEVLNKNVGEVSSEDGACANKIARELAGKFAAARLEEKLYEGRLEISVNYTSSGKLDAEDSMIEGNENGLNLLGFDHRPGVSWSDIRKGLVPSEWPTELVERAIPAMASGQLPPPLSPFRTPSGIVIPVIVKAEIVDRKVRHVSVIFVRADSTRLGPLFEGSSLPVGMPNDLKSLVHVLRLIFRARWDILEPRWTEATNDNPSKERCAEIGPRVLSEYKALECDLENLQLSGASAFHNIFAGDLWHEIDACSTEWLALKGELEAKPPDNAQELSRLLTALLRNNAKWMNMAATQFARYVAQNDALYSAV